MTVETEVLVVGGGATGAGVDRDLTLRGVDEPDQLDALVAEFDGQGPTDRDVVGAE